MSAPILRGTLSRGTTPRPCLFLLDTLDEDGRVVVLLDGSFAYAHLVDIRPDLVDGRPVSVATVDVTSIAAEEARRALAAEREACFDAFAKALAADGSPLTTQEVLEIVEAARAARGAS